MEIPAGLPLVFVSNEDGYSLYIHEATDKIVLVSDTLTPADKKLLVKRGTGVAELYLELDESGAPVFRNGSGNRVTEMSNKVKVDQPTDTIKEDVPLPQTPEVIGAANSQSVMKSALVDLLRGIKAAQPEFMLRNEAAIKQSVFYRVLMILGWDVFNMNEVKEEDLLDKDRVDFALKKNGVDKIFVELKRPSEDLSKHEEQILKYVFKNGAVPLGILTNGVQWRFYLPMKQVNWKNRRFLTFDVLNDQEEDIIIHLINLLQKLEVFTDRSVKYAEGLYLQQLISSKLASLITNPPTDFLDFVNATYIHKEDPSITNNQLKAELTKLFK